MVTLWICRVVIVVCGSIVVGAVMRRLWRQYYGNHQDVAHQDETK